MDEQDLLTQNAQLKTENQRLKNENYLKNGWVSLVSHNFKGTFSNLIMLIEALDNNSISKDDFFNLLPQIRQDASNNLRLIADSSVWTRTKRDGYQPEMKELDVREVFTKLETAFQEKLNEKNLRLNWRGDVVAKIYSDHFLLINILERIVDNAIKYSHSGETITLSVEEQSGGIAISVEDEGVGMNKNQLETIFTFDAPVYRGTRGELGVGLGMKIVQDFLTLLHGKINISSEKNNGTKICIFLPE